MTAIYTHYRKRYYKY